jgi:hypothetical protein
MRVHQKDRELDFLADASVHQRDRTFMQLEKFDATKSVYMYSKLQIGTKK